ncbi:MAG: single-stranded-DNA-specific exonuclease RecJ [Paracoccaceae bacterium]|nr:single-stranded-DNA-specific exonuclease RecJ [Paracoccaceae bacterium]
MGFLGVSHSLTERCWVGPNSLIERTAEAIAQKSDLPTSLCTVMARLGVTPEDAQQYLEPQLRTLLPDPRSFIDMTTASARLLKALDKSEKIVVFADYDVDGAASAALVLTWLGSFGSSATLYVPDRIDEGYGPNDAAMAALARDNDLIICVDCGTVSHDPIAAAKGADVIVLDHHLGTETVPDCVAVVNPNRQDESGDLSHLCAAGVVFLCLVECGRLLREAGRKGPDLMGYLDLVALATVADVAPLIGVNRAFVRQGLKVMATRSRPGLVALADQAKMESTPAAYHLGFLLGPRINAGGRVGQADLGARLLSTNNVQEARKLSERLDQLNTERRQIEETVRAEAFAQAKERGFDAPLVWAAGEGWHPGVVGIVAARLKEAANRPAIVIGLDGKEGKGSGRSVSGIDLGATIQNLALQGVLLKGGGHKMAAGLTVSQPLLEPAMEKLAELLKKQGADKLGVSDLHVDSVLMPTAATTDLIAQLENAGPFGAGAPAPRFAFPDMVIIFAKQVGENHLKIRFGDGLGTCIDGISFGAFDTALGPTLERHDGRRFHLAGRLEINEWRGKRSVQLRLEDAAHTA